MIKRHRLMSLVMLLLINIMFPLNVFAYSDYILAGGQNIGIQLNTDGVLVVGTYKVGDDDPASNANILVGDKIIMINDEKISSISEMLDVLSKADMSRKVDVTFIRNDKLMNTKLELIVDDDKIYKTGLYVKDSINGVGTLTFIDPNTRVFGALGHEIIEKTTGRKLEIKDGKIYNSIVTGINPSNNGNPGEKNARYDTNDIYGNITENSTAGIFGTYTDKLPDNKLYKVASSDDIKLDKASIFTVVDGEKVEEFSINILKINENDKGTKNILFEVTDERLLSLSGGIVQGMSGSPIIQNDKIIGAVTHVVVDAPTKGYGIFITNMLEEAED